jgi:hypothetical protein
MSNQIGAEIRRPPGAIARTIRMDSIMHPIRIMGLAQNVEFRIGKEIDHAKAPFLGDAAKALDHLSIRFAIHILVMGSRVKEERAPIRTFFQSGDRLNRPITRFGILVRQGRPEFAQIPTVIGRKLDDNRVELLLGVFSNKPLETAEVREIARVFLPKGRSGNRLFIEDDSVLLFEEIAYRFLVALKSKGHGRAKEKNPFALQGRIRKDRGVFFAPKRIVWRSLFEKGRRMVKLGIKIHALYFSKKKGPGNP